MDNVVWCAKKEGWRARAAGLQKYFPTKEEAVEWVSTNTEVVILPRYQKRKLVRRGDELFRHLRERR